MTKQEQKIIIEVATDIKWLMREVEGINNHLKDLNAGSIKAMSKLVEHEQKIGNNSSNTNRIWMVLGIVLSALFALKFTGVL